MNNRLTYYKFWSFLGILMVLLVIYISLVSNPPDLVHFNQSDKIMHYLAYMILMCWFGQIYSNKTESFLVALYLVCLGIFLEVIQGLGGFREFEYCDMVANTLGVVFGFILSRKRCFNFLYFLERLYKRTTDNSITY